MSECMDKAVKMMGAPMTELPKPAVAYARYLCDKYGMCGEVFLTAWAHYLQAVEGLDEDDSLYQIDDVGAEFFRTVQIKDNTKEEKR